MDFSELINRIKNGENLHTEFKEWPLHNDDLAAGIVAFANTDGGLILLGVNNYGEITGINEDTDRVSQKIDNVANNNCEPPVTVIQERFLTPSNKAVIVISISKGEQRPYRTNKGVYYIRTSSGRRQASREELLRLFQATESLYYDETPLFRSSYADLEERLIEDLFNTASDQGIDTSTITQERLLMNWRLITERSGSMLPTITGSLFLSKNPQMWLPYAYISVLRIPGNDISVEPQDQKKIDGNMKSMLEDAMRFLKIHLFSPHSIEELQPEAKPEFPVEALREVLVNALAHRDYTISAPIRLIIYSTFAA
ncbi:MAG: putative DNA binding domain-containing protein [Clostridium sp.]|nr:putative DNA binding domain-containing protein [Clostridium sp.]